MLETIWQQIIDPLLIAPLSYPMDPAKRIFWGFLLSSLIIASLTVAWQTKSWNLRKQAKSFFNPSYWLHPSSRIDFGFLFLNNGLRVLVLVPLIGGQLAVTVWVAGKLQFYFGDFDPIRWSWFAIGVCYTLTFFLMEDLSRFLLHTAMHRVPFLWRFHKTHHSAEVLTPFTLHRTHPVEMTLYYLRSILVFALVSGVFVYLFRNRVNGFDILGVDLLGFLFNFLAANLRHSHIWLSFGVVEKWFISPAQHQIHHSSAAEHRDKNFGTCLAIWDKWLGSWVPAGSKRKLRFGLSS